MSNNVERIDDVLSFLVIKKLVTPVNKTKAFKLGLVDGKGNTIKSPETPEEKDALTLFDKVTFKLKRMLGSKISQLNNFLYVQTLDNSIYNQLVVKGAVEQRAGIKRVRADIDNVMEKHDIGDIDDLITILINDEVHSTTLMNGSNKR